MKAFTKRRLLSYLGASAIACPAGFSLLGADDALAAGSISRKEVQKIDSLVAGFMREYAVPGLALSVAYRGKIVLDQGYGYRDQENRFETQPGTIFRIASLSKPITAVALYTLVEAGKLKLSDKVFGEGAILGARYGTRAYGPNLRSLTVDHLLTHTSGGWPNDYRDPMFMPPP